MVDRLIDDKGVRGFFFSQHLGSFPTNSYVDDIFPRHFGYSLIVFYYMFCVASTVAHISIALIFLPCNKIVIYHRAPAFDL
jgi:hypothetical protein